MKRLIAAMAFLATASFAYPPSMYYGERSQTTKWGIDVGGLFVVPVVSPSGGTDANSSLGLRIAPTVEFPVDGPFSLRGFAGYEFATWGYGFGNSDGSYDDISVRTQFLTFGLAGQLAFAPGGFASLGVSADVPILSEVDDEVDYGDGTGESFDGRFHGDQTAVFLDFGLGYRISPSVGLVVGYRLPLVPYYDQDGFSIGLHQINIGLRFAMR